MEPVNDSGGRVTRSLRKRLPSMDSENSSRPGTPVPSKLAAITEISSPSRPTPRITRRNSVSGVATPVKTPSKRIGATTSVISEITESVTPARRSTRRRSPSINESEATPQVGSKAPAFDKLPEEIEVNIKQTVVRLKRFDSKSPEQIISTDKINVKTEPKTPDQIKTPEVIKKTNDYVEQQVKTESKSPRQSSTNNPEERKSVKSKAQPRQKPGPKFQTRLLTDDVDDLSDVEVIVVEKENIDENRMKSNLTTINLIDDEDDNELQQIKNAKLAEKSQKQIKDSVPSSDKTEQNIANIDLMERDDGHQLDTTIDLTAQEIQQNDTAIDLMECDDDDDDDGQQVDTSEKLLTESSINDQEMLNINVKNSTEVALNTENVKEETTTNTEIEPTRAYINEKKSIKLKSQKTPVIESSVVKNETLCNESKSEEISTKETLENNTPPELPQLESSVNKDDKEVSSTETLENYKPQDTSQIESSRIIRETLNKSISEAIPTKETLDNSIQEENKFQAVIDVTDDTTKSTESDKIIPSITINDDNRKATKADVEESDKFCKITQPPQGKYSRIIRETLNKSISEDIPTKETLENSIQKENKSQAVVEVTDDTTKSTESDNIIQSITINDDNRKDSKADVEESDKFCKIPQPPQGKYSATIIEVINITPTKLGTNASSDCKSTKKVEFISSPSTDKIKTVYPRTPAFTKNKCIINADATRDVKQSFSNEETANASMLSFNDIEETNNEETQEYQHDDESTVSICEESNEMEVDENEIGQNEKQSIVNYATRTPPRILKSEQLQIAQSSTPNIVDDSENTDDLQQLSDNEVEQDIKSPLKESIVPKSTESLESKVENNIESNSVEKVETELKWVNPSVKGKITEGAKLDALVKPKQTPQKREVNEEHEIEEDHEEELKSAKRRSHAIIFSSESEDEEEDARGQEDDEEEELGPGEKPYKRKHDFHDDEAMEVGEDYQSGDSMDSEERREMIENEIPVDGESLGSNTTDDGHTDTSEGGEESEIDSFIVSDNEEETNLQLQSSEDSDDEDDLIDDKHDQKKKKMHKRIQCAKETDLSSSSSDDLEDERGKEEEEEKEKEDEGDTNDTDKKTQSNTVDSHTKNINTSVIKSSDNNIRDSCELSDPALHLQSTSESDLEGQTDDANISRKEILRTLNQSDRFNKSVRNLNPEVGTSPIEHSNETQQTESNFLNISDNNKLEKFISIVKGMLNEENEERSETANDDKKKQQKEEGKKCTDEETTSSKSFVTVINKITREKHAEFSHLGEVSATTESDNEEGNANNNKSASSLLNRSGGNLTKSKRRSFTIEVSLKGGDIEAEIKSTKKLDSPSTSSLPSSPSANAEQDDQLSSDDARYLENIKHMPLPLGHPLVRTRRQSLALPNNPDMEICSGSNAINKKTKRKSLGILCGNELNPSQSFIDSMELRKSEFDRQVAKRKRLSKSVCGTADTMDNSTVDIDVRHLHKRSKLSAEKSILMENYDSMENINSSKLSNKVTVSSTPHQKTIKTDSDDIQHILNRCDEILEAANRAKLQLKLQNKKIKVKSQKKNRNKTAQQSIRELHQHSSDGERKSIPKDDSNEEKTRSAVTHALKAAGVIISKNTQIIHKTDSEDLKRQSSDILKGIDKSEQIMKKKNKRDVPSNDNRMREFYSTSTTAGNFIDMPQTPEKKKKKNVKIIKLSTGKVCVEPITPKRQSVVDCTGTVFRESPITPLTVGFKVSNIPCNEHHRSILKDRKRKRNFDDPTRHSLPKPQWTQSGIFIEEEIPTMRRIARSEASQFSSSRRLNKRQTENDQCNANRNFKENAIMRHDIKRDTTRHILQLK